MAPPRASQMRTGPFFRKELTMPLDTVQYTANAYTTGGQDGTSRRDAGRLDVQVPSLGTPGIRAFIMTASKLSRRSYGLLAVAPSLCCEVHTAIEP